MLELLQFLVKSIVDDGATVEEGEVGDRIEYVIKADSDSIAKVIGKKGATIKMLRNLMKVRATLEKKVFYISVVEA